jgi:integrase
VVKRIRGVRFEDAASAYLRVREMHVKPRTFLAEKYTMAAVRRAIGGNVWLSELDDDFWWNYFYGEEGRVNDLGAGAFNGELRRIRAFVDLAVRRGWLPADAAEYLRKDIRSRTEHLRSHLILTPAQLLQLVECAAYPSHRIALAIGANTALRGSEIVGIRLGKVNLPAGEMLVTLWKNGRDEVVPITSRLDNEIRRWLVEYEKATIEQGLGPLQPEWYLVPAQWPGRDREPGSTGYTKDSPFRLRLRPERHPAKPHEIVKMAMDRMGMEYDVGEGFHTTRRAFARAFHDGLVSQGDPNALRKTAALLHHANTTMTERYLRLNVESVAVSQTLKGVDFLGNLVAGDNVVPLKKLGGPA